MLPPETKRRPIKSRLTNDSTSVCVSVCVCVKINKHLVFMCPLQITITSATAWLELQFVFVLSFVTLACIVYASAGESSQHSWYAGEQLRLTVARATASSGGASALMAWTFAPLAKYSKCTLLQQGVHLCVCLCVCACACVCVCVCMCVCVCVRVCVASKRKHCALKVACRYVRDLV